MKIAEDIIDSPKSRYDKLFYRESFDKNEPIKKLEFKIQPLGKLIVFCKFQICAQLFMKLSFEGVYRLWKGQKSKVVVKKGQK